MEAKLTKFEELRRKFYPTGAFSEESNRRRSLTMKGKVKSQEHRENLSKSLMGKKKSEEAKRNMSLVRTGTKLSEETKQKMSNSRKGKHMSEETRNLMCEIHKGKPFYKTVNPMLGKHPSEETLVKMSEVQKVRWQGYTQEERDKRIKRMQKDTHLKPTLPEQKMQALLDYCCPESFVYTGDGSSVMPGLNPDFTHCNGIEQVIEVFGDYWHQGENPQNLVDKYKQLGIDCLVIWEHELEEPEKVIERIKIFHEGGG